MNIKVTPVIVVHATASMRIISITIALMRAFYEYEDRCEGRDSFRASILARSRPSALR